MGTYNEPRPPSGAPVDGERDVWLADGKVKFGHWNDATSAWAVDKEIDYATAGLAKNHYVAWSGAGPTDGWHDIDLSGHVPTGTTAAFIVWMGTGTGATINIADTSTPANLYGFSNSGSSKLWGSCMVPLDSNYKFRIFAADTNLTAFYLYVTYAG